MGSGPAVIGWEGTRVNPSPAEHPRSCWGAAGAGEQFRAPPGCAPSPAGSPAHHRELGQEDATASPGGWGQRAISSQRAKENGAMSNQSLLAGYKSPPAPPRSPHHASLRV